MPVVRVRSFVVLLFSGLLLAVSCMSTTTAEDQVGPAIEKGDSGEAGNPSTSLATTPAATGEGDSSTSSAPSNDQIMPTQATPNATDIAIGSGALTTLTLNGVRFEFTTEIEIKNPSFLAESNFSGGSTDVSGRVLIHNVERDLAGADSHGLVDGRDATRLHYVWHSPEDPYHVAVSAGAWWIDVVLIAGNPSEQDTLRDEFLASLTITERDGDIPLVEDGAGWLFNFNTISIDAAESGFMFALSPNCDPANLMCHPNVGTLFPGWSPAFTLLGVRPGSTQGVRSLAFPGDFEARIVDLGPIGELVSCEGVPAFDPLLLSERLPLGDAIEETRTYTGINRWNHHYQLGVETWFTGDADDPEVVATYLSNEDGTWNTRSVLACE